MVRVETRLRMESFVTVGSLFLLVKIFFFKKTASGGLIEFGLSFFLV